MMQPRVSRSEDVGRPPGSWFDTLAAGLRARATARRWTAERRVREILDLSEQLLARRGEASVLTIAGQVVAAVDRLDEEQTAALLGALGDRFGPDRTAVDAAIDDWRTRHDPQAMLRLSAAVEPPRQELFRRLNMALGGTATLVRLRARLLELLDRRPELAPVDADLRHLFGSWFNRGFLRLERVTWDTAASVLERLIRYEAVHEIRGWDDLRSRLAPDRRCYAFFHPTLPGEPLIFVEVALTRGLPEAIAPLIDPGREPAEPERADTAVFYSISNCQPGLRGVSFGDLLIKQVVASLAVDLPRLKSYATLSPLPGLAAALAKEGPGAEFTPARVGKLVAEQAEELCALAGVDDPVAALRSLLAAAPPRPAAVSRALARLALAYLVQVRRGVRVADSVAHFHLANGARLERIDPDGDLGPSGLPSLGVMVNYVYELGRVELNHERYVENGWVAMAPALRSAAKRVEAVWSPKESESC